MQEVWNWNDAAESGEVVVESVQAVAVYVNTIGNIVIRQESSALEDEDSIVVIPKSGVKALIKALNATLKK